MRLLDIVCKELGVEIGEGWFGNDGERYTIDKNGNLHSGGMGKWEDIVSGTLIPKWKPEIGEEYFAPRLTRREDTRYSFIRWEADEADSWYWEHNLVCKTKEKAIELATKMIKRNQEG